MTVSTQDRTPSRRIEQAFREWWRALQPREPDTKPVVPESFATRLGRADRAELRRQRTIAGLLLQPATFALDKQVLGSYRALIGVERLDDAVTTARLQAGIAMAAGVVAHVVADLNEGQAEHSLATRLGQKIGDRRRMSELHFRNLQAVRDPESLRLQMTRALALADGKADVGRLGRDLLRWADELERSPSRPALSVRYRWARDYYLATAKDIVTDDDVPAEPELPA